MPVPKEHENDISIGPNIWIPFVDTPDRVSASGDELDPVLGPIDSLFALLETQCVADCCSIDAYGFWPEDIDQAKSQLKDVSVVQGIRDALALIQLSDSEFFRSHRMNWFFHRTEIERLLQHILEHVDA